jgi:hypothetical protein
MARGVAPRPPPSAGPGCRRPGPGPRVALARPASPQRRRRLAWATAPYRAPEPPRPGGAWPPLAAAVRAWACPPSGGRQRRPRGHSPAGLGLSGAGGAEPPPALTPTPSHDAPRVPGGAGDGGHSTCRKARTWWCCGREGTPVVRRVTRWLFACQVQKSVTHPFDHYTTL